MRFPHGFLVAQMSRVITYLLHRVNGVIDQFRKVFTIAGKLVPHGRRVVLNLPREGPRREKIESVLGRVREVSLQFG